MRLFGLLLPLVLLLFFTGCAPKKSSFEFSQGEFVQSSWDALYIDEAELELFFESFNRSCHTHALTREYCGIATLEEFQEAFVPMLVHGSKDMGGFMTGYYEPMLYGSRVQSQKYYYPIYERPSDMYTVDLGSIYSDLNNYRLRGRIEGNKIVPYYSAQEIRQGKVDAKVIAYVDSIVDAFFLHIQGSGKVTLDSGEVINVGYADQNGHRYYAIGRYMYQQGYLQEVSMQTIRQFLEKNPDKINHILAQNHSYVFFTEKNQGATGALGIELVPNASVAVDRRFIPLAMPLYIKSEHPQVHNLVVAQDVGGAIRGEGRVDYFFGSSEEGVELAGQMKEPIELYMFVPRDIFD